MATDPTLPARLQACIDGLEGVRAQSFLIHRALGPAALPPPAIWRGRSAKRHRAMVDGASADLTGASVNIGDLIELLAQHKKKIEAQLRAEAEARRRAELKRLAEQEAAQAQPASPWQPWRPTG